MNKRLAKIPVRSAVSADSILGLSVRGVQQVFETAAGRKTALVGVDIDVVQGSFVSIVGRSGCGKSTLLRIIAGLIVPTDGTVTIMGRPCADYLRDRRLGFVFQDTSLLPWKTVTQNIALSLKITGGMSSGEIAKITGGMSSDEIADRVQEMLRVVRLEEVGGHYPAQLSGGMRQRVSIARALAYEPEILLMDEPFGALDEFTRREMHDEMIRIWEERPLTVLFVTHSLAEAMALSDRVVVMAAQSGGVQGVVDMAELRPRTRQARTTPTALSQLAELEELLDEQ